MPWTPWVGAADFGEAAYNNVDEPLANWFRPGHRIRVEVSSSNFPPYERNPNSVRARDQCDAVTATQRVVHDSRFPSAVTLPVAS